MTALLALLSTVGCLASIASAQSAAAPVTTSLFIINADKQSLDASVIGADRTATTYSINCPPGADSNHCGFSPGLTLTQNGASGFAGFMSNDRITLSWSCKLQESTSASCVESSGGLGASTTGVESGTLTADDITFFPVAVTAGQAKLAVASTAAPQASGSTTSGASTAKATGAASGSTFSTASMTSTAATTSKTSGSEVSARLQSTVLALALFASFYTLLAF